MQLLAAVSLQASFHLVILPKTAAAPPGCCCCCSGGGGGGHVLTVCSYIWPTCETVDDVLVIHTCSNNGIT